MNRSNRLFVGVARRVVGVPAPSGGSPEVTANNSRSSSPHGFREKMEVRSAQHEADLVNLEAEALLERGETEAAAAREGRYSEPSTADRSRQNSRSGSPTKSFDDEGGPVKRFSSPARSRPLSVYDGSSITPLQKRASWNNPSQMSAAELAIANTNLMMRLQPFLSNPLMNTPISAFFYNDKISRQKTMETDGAGHFVIRASLDFIPTHVRILASENLSATEEIMITEPVGITVISDIDDTIKHSAISGGAREIFRNVFIRDLSDLTIDGVREWYKRMESMDVKFHYVSNSPWQLFPVLTKYFSTAGLPAGSFHLKQYSGMLAGIFEPVAERKKGTLEKIMRDFPDRKYILIGDSGEADLEVYTDVVTENPGRILGVFIRDVTTSIKKGFFDSSMGPLAGTQASRAPAPLPTSSRLRLNGHKRQGSQLRDEDDRDLKAAIAASLAEADAESSKRQADSSDEKNSRPQLPPRAKTEAPAAEEDLIDLNWENDGQPLTKFPEPTSNTPSEPLKLPRKQPPPRPRKPSTSVKPGLAPVKPTSNAEPAPEIPATTSKPSRPAAPSARETYSYGTAARQKISSAYNALPSFTGHSSSHPPSNNHDDNTDTPESHQPQIKRPAAISSQSNITPRTNASAPPVPARKPLSSYPAAAAASLSHLYSSGSSSSSTPYHTNHPSLSNPSLNSSSSTATDSPLPLYSAGMPAVATNAATIINKKEEVWNRRWARSKAIMDDHGVLLKTWRVGGDVEQDAVGLVEAWKEGQKKDSAGEGEKKDGNITESKGKGIEKGKA